MIIMRIKGGLGNQLFQYSMGYALAKRNNQELAFNVSFTSNMTSRGYKLPFLNVCDFIDISNENIPNKICLCKNKYINKAMRILKIGKIKIEEYVYVLETREVYTEKFLVDKYSNAYFDGYFQSPKYFEKYRNDLLKQITPNYPPESQYIDALKMVQNCNSVAVHVRRGDFKKSYNKFHYLLEKDYYVKAIDYIRNNVENPIFFFFSDDINWVKTNFGESEDFRFLNIKTTNGDIDDLMLMKNCNHIICANSTFSWWAAWLNESENAIRVVPTRQYGMDGMIPSDWIKI